MSRGLQLSRSVVGVVIALMAAAVPGASSQNPFGFFAPSIPPPTPAVLARLAAGDATVRVLDARHGEVGIAGAIPINVDGERLAVWASTVEDLLKGRYVRTIRRFSNPPRLSDLDDLVLEEQDVEDLQRCRPGRCGVKLSDQEMTRLQAANVSASAERRLLVLQTFREIVLARAQQYLREGFLNAMYHDKRKPVALAAVSSQLARSFGFLDAYDTRAGESLLYWSIETLGGRPIVGITHSMTLRSSHPGCPEVMVIARRVFASHYVDGQLGVTAILEFDQQRYLIYVNRARVDLLGGLWGGVLREVMEHRLKDEGPRALQGLKRTLESGLPPQRRPPWPIG